MYRAVAVIYTMKFIFSDVQDFSWVQFYGLLNHVLPFPWKCSSSSSVPLPSYVKGSVCRCKWLDQCLYVGPFLLPSSCFRASFLSDFFRPILYLRFRCIEASRRLSESNVVVASSNRSAWEKSLKRLQSSFRLHVDRSGDGSGDVSGCNNIQRSRCLINKLKCFSLFPPLSFYIYIYIYKKMSLPSTVLLGFFTWMCGCSKILASNLVNKSSHSFKYNQLLCPKDVLVINYDDGFKGIYRIKQCMYSLEQSHGAVEKKKKKSKLCRLHVFAESSMVCCGILNMKSNMLFWYIWNRHVESYRDVKSRLQ